MKTNLFTYVLMFLLSATGPAGVYAGSPFDNYDAIVPLNPLSAVVNKTGVSVCGCGKDGTITVTPTGGEMPYSYEWSGTGGFAAGNTSALYNLPVGYYNVTITDAQLQQVTITGIQVDFAFAVQVTNSGSLSGTCGNSGTIILYGNAGIRPYTYSLDGTSYQCNNTFSGLAPGTYTAYVRDLAGCTNSKTITVGQADPLAVHPFVRPNCTTNGSIEIFLTGGVAPYLYSINGIDYQVGNTFENLAPGQYTCYVKDSKGCIAAEPVTLSQGVPLTVNTRKTNSSSCINDGTIQVNSVAGGVAPYTYSLNGTIFQSSNSFGQLAAGNYTVTAKDSRGCLGSVNVSINLSIINVTAYASNAGNCVVANGKIQLFRTGGFGPYTYSLDGNSYQSSNVFNNLPAGIYSGFVKDSRNCVGILPGINVGPVSCLPSFTTNNNEPIKNTQVREDAGLKIHVYPNPSTEEFTVELKWNKRSEKVFVTVTDLAGRRVYQYEEAAHKQIKFGKNLKAGMYLVEIVQGKNKQVSKIVKE